jgi:hypothetical protein
MVTVKIRDREQILEVSRQRAPRVGSSVKYQGRKCLVLAVEYPLKHRVALEAFRAA